MEFWKDTTAFQYATPTPAQKHKYQALRSACPDARIEHLAIAHAEQGASEDLERKQEAWAAGFHASVVLWDGQDQLPGFQLQDLACQAAQRGLAKVDAEGGQLAVAVLRVSFSGEVCDQVASCIRWPQQASSVPDSKAIRAACERDLGNRPPCQVQIEAVSDITNLLSKVRPASNPGASTSTGQASNSTAAHQVLHLTLWQGQGRQRLCSSFTIISLVSSTACGQPAATATAILAEPDPIKQPLGRATQPALGPAGLLMQQRAGLLRLVEELAARQKDSSGEARPLLRARECRLAALLAPLLAGNISTLVVFPVQDDRDDDTQEALVRHLSSIYRCMLRQPGDTSPVPKLHRVEDLVAQSQHHPCSAAPAPMCERTVPGAHSRPQLPSGRRSQAAHRTARDTGPSDVGRRSDQSGAPQAQDMSVQSSGKTVTGSRSTAVTAPEESAVQSTQPLASPVHKQQPEQKQARSHQHTQQQKQVPPTTVKQQDAGASDTLHALKRKLRAELDALQSKVWGAMSKATSPARPGTAPARSLTPHRPTTACRPGTSSSQPASADTQGAVTAPTSRQHSPLKCAASADALPSPRPSAASPVCTLTDRSGSPPHADSVRVQRKTSPVQSYAAQYELRRSLCAGVPSNLVPDSTSSSPARSPTRQARSVSPGCRSPGARSTSDTGYALHAPGSARSQRGAWSARTEDSNAWHTPARVQAVLSPARRRVASVSPARRLAAEALRSVARQRRADDTWKPSPLVLAAWRTPADAIMQFGRRVGASPASRRHSADSTTHKHDRQSNTSSPRRRATLDSAPPAEPAQPAGMLPPRTQLARHRAARSGPAGSYLDTLQQLDTSPRALRSSSLSMENKIRIARDLLARSTQSQPEVVAYAAADLTGCTVPTECGSACQGQGLGTVGANKGPLDLEAVRSQSGPHRLPSPGNPRDVAWDDADSPPGAPTHGPELSGNLDTMLAYATKTLAANLSNSPPDSTIDTVGGYAAQGRAGSFCGQVEASLGPVRRRLSSSDGGDGASGNAGVSSLEAQVSSLLKVVQRERRAREAAEHALRVAEATLQEDKAAFALREADLQAEVQKQQALVGILQGNLPADLQPLTALYEAHVSQAESKAWQLSKTNAELAGRVAALELQLSHCQQTSGAGSSRAAPKPPAFTALKQQVCELMQRCDTAEGELRDAKRVARVYALLAKQAQRRVGAHSPRLP